MARCKHLHFANPIIAVIQMDHQPKRNFTPHKTAAIISIINRLSPALKVMNHITNATKMIITMAVKIIVIAEVGGVSFSIIVIV